MTDFNPDDLDLVEEFVPSLKAALRLAADARNKACSPSQTLSAKQWMGQKSQTRHLWRVFVRAAAGEARLNPLVFRAIVTHFLKGFVPDSSLSYLDAAHDAYQVWTQGCSEKTNPSWPTGFIAKKDVVPYFQARVLDGAHIEAAQVFGGPKGFFSLLDARVDQPACTGRVGAAITNAEITCRFMIGQRRRLQFQYRMPDDQWEGCLAAAAWWGGWAAYQIGHWKKFEWFRAIADRAATTSGWIGAVATSSLQGYATNWRGGMVSVSASAQARRTYETYFANRRGAFELVAPEIRSEIFLNPARAVVRRGGGLSDKPPGFDNSVADFLRHSRDAKPVGMYSILSDPYSDLAEAEGALNEGDFMKAMRALSRVEAAIPVPRTRSLDFLAWNYEFLLGRVQEAVTRQRNNPAMRRALLGTIEARSLTEALRVSDYLKGQ